MCHFLMEISTTNSNRTFLFFPNIWIYLNYRECFLQNMIRPGDRQLTQQIGIDPMYRMVLTGLRLAIDRRDPHPPHYYRYLPHLMSCNAPLVIGSLAAFDVVIKHIAGQGLSA